MLDALRARLGPFAARFALAFLLLLAVWRFFSPFYAQGMAVMGQTLLTATGMLPTGSQLEARDRRVWITRPVTKLDGSQGTATVNVLDDATYVNIVLFAALTLATPLLAWPARVKVFLAGGAALSLLHLADLSIKLRWTAVYPGLPAHGVIPEAASPIAVKAYEWVYAFFSVNGFGLFPILVWFAAVAFWWPRADPEHTGETGRHRSRRAKGGAARRR